MPSGSLRTVERESHLSWDEMQEGQTLEPQRASSEEDIPAIGVPERGPNDLQSIMDKKQCVN